MALFIICKSEAFMKKCIVCGKEIADFKKYICESCSQFLKWKHGDNYRERLKEFRKQSAKSYLTKFFRRKK